MQNLPSTHFTFFSPLPLFYLLVLVWGHCTVLRSDSWLCAWRLLLASSGDHTQWPEFKLGRPRTSMHLVAILLLQTLPLFLGLFPLGRKYWPKLISLGYTLEMPGKISGFSFSSNLINMWRFLSRSISSECPSLPKLKPEGEEGKKRDLLTEKC